MKVRKKLNSILEFQFVQLMKKEIVLSSSLAIFMMLASLLHVFKPAMFDPFIPDSFPKLLVNYLAGIIEFLLGVGLFYTTIRSKVALGLVIVFIVFLPIHIQDVFRDEPIIGSKLVAYVRLPIQFVLIYWAWYICRLSIGKPAIAKS